MYRVTKEAGQPFPTLSDDPVIQFQLLEVAIARVAQEDKAAQKQKEIEDWRNDTSSLKQHQ